MISVKYSRGADPCEGKQLINVYYGSTKDNVCDSPLSISVYVNSTSSILQDVADDGQGIWTASDCNVCAPTGWYMDNPSSNGIAYFFDRDQCYITDASICNREAIWVRTSPSSSKLCAGIGTLYNVFTDSEIFLDATGMWADGISNTPANVPSAQWYSVATYSGDTPNYIRIWADGLDGGSFGSTEICQLTPTTIQMNLNLSNNIDSTSSYLYVYVDGTLYQASSNSLQTFTVNVQPNSVLQITAQSQDNTFNNDVIIGWYDDTDQSGQSPAPLSSYAETTFNYNVPNLPTGSSFNLYVDATGFDSGDFTVDPGPTDGGGSGPTDPGDGPSDFAP